MKKSRHALLLIGRRIWRLSGGGGSSSSNPNSTTTPASACRKPFTSKASNRAAVHGVKPPVPDILDKEQVQKEIEKAKQEKEAKRKQIEEALESHLGNYSNPDSSSAQ